MLDCIVESAAIGGRVIEAAIQIPHVIQVAGFVGVGGNLAAQLQLLEINFVEGSAIL